MNIELLTVGTELLLGFTIDTNGAEIGRLLAAHGVRVVRRTSVADDGPAIREATDSALMRTGAVLITGGLGPTRDDVTKHATSDLMQMPLGRCFRKTQLFVLLIFCPPAPEPRTNFSSRSFSEMPSAAMRWSRSVSLSEEIGFCIGGAEP